MKRVFLLSFVCIIAFCCQAKKPMYIDSVGESNAIFSSNTLIIFYDNAIGRSYLLKAVRKYGATILYQYEIVNAIAVSIPAGKTLEDAIVYFEKVKGVLFVSKDYIYHID